MSVEGDAVVRYVAGMRQLWGLADYGALAARLAGRLRHGTPSCRARRVGDHLVVFDRLTEIWPAG